MLKFLQEKISLIPSISVIIPSDERSVVAGPHTSLFSTTKAACVPTLRRLGLNNSGFCVFTVACFDVLYVSKRLSEVFVQKSWTAFTIDECRMFCLMEMHFQCRGFTFRYFYNNTLPLIVTGTTTLFMDIYQCTQGWVFTRYLEFQSYPTTMKTRSF